MLLTKNQLHNRVFVISCWLDVIQYYNMQKCISLSTTSFFTLDHTKVAHVYKSVV